MARDVELKKFNLEELKQYNGQAGKPAYLTFEGKVTMLQTTVHGRAAIIGAFTKQGKTSLKLSKPHHTTKKYLAK